MARALAPSQETWPLARPLSLIRWRLGRGGGVIFPLGALYLSSVREGVDLKWLGPFASVRVSAQMTPGALQK